MSDILWLPFDEARAYVRSLGLKNESEWIAYYKSDLRPKNIPTSPRRVYQSQWLGLGDWLGTGTIRTQDRVYLPFNEARAFVHTLKLRGSNDWTTYRKSGQKPANIPAAPWLIYKNEWQSLGDWLGTGRVATQQRKYAPFEEARAFVRSLGFKNSHEWETYCRTDRTKPAGIPAAPWQVYETEWTGYGDWLGTGFIALFNREYLPFEEAREFARSLALKTWNEWHAFLQTGQKPANIPASPEHVYKAHWKGIGDFLGTGAIANQDRVYLSFEEARTYVRTLGLRIKDEWFAYCKSEAKHPSIPVNPNRHYEQDWKNWGDWLGTKRIANQRRVFLPFEEAREYIHGLNIRNQKEWHTYSRSGDRPSSIPADPQNAYKGQFKGWGDFLGTGSLGNEARRVTPEHKQGVRRAVNQRRRARKLDVQGTYTPEEILAQFKRQKGRCYYAACGFSKFKKDSTRAFGYAFDIEHTFPLARVAGSDIPANTIDYIVLACDSCNGKKYNKFPWEWPEGGRLL